MNKIFCVSCGTKNVYETTKPKFCANCGEAISGVSQATQQTSDEVEEVSVSSIDLDGLKRGIGVQYNKSVTKIEDVFGKGADGSASRRAPSNLPSGKDIIKHNMQDCAQASRSKDINE
jgi:predicted RNA-binding Zn-ribbon protein involved in translation (DUF1610 family)